MRQHGGIRVRAQTLPSLQFWSSCLCMCSPAQQFTGRSIQKPSRHPRSRQTRAVVFILGQLVELVGPERRWGTEILCVCTSLTEYATSPVSHTSFACSCHSPRILEFGRSSIGHCVLSVCFTQGQRSRFKPNEKTIKAADLKCTI